MTELVTLAEMLGNRIAKNARHLGKWARRERVTCWRVYDRDIPELPITVDTYEGALVINDYRSFRDELDAQSADAWLHAMADAAVKALDAREVFIKQRERLVNRREGHQYTRLSDEVSEEGWRIVHEGGQRFRVNLRDYVDTGLFLDHRITRARAAAEAGATMLNLFAYTGAFSVHAAAAGKATTSVDMSRTYLDWARANFELNDLRGDFVQSDVRELLRDARDAGRQWDVVVVDPPTFSNSKRMDYTWDVQRDHVALLDDVLAVTSPGGVVWFSTNRRRFKLELEAGADLAITDETRATIPPDFRDPKVHHAYRIVKRSRR